MVRGAEGTVPALEGWRGEKHAGRGVGGDTLLLIKPPRRSQKHFQIQDGPRMGFWRGADGWRCGLAPADGRDSLLLLFAGGLGGFIRSAPSPRRGRDAGKGKRRRRKKKKDHLEQ